MDLASNLRGLIELASLGIEVVAVAIIVLSTFAGILTWLYRYAMRQAHAAAYEELRRRLGRALLLGLEILVAADIIRTVALEPTLTSVAILGLLVLIRTFLSWSLVVEIEHRWPWQSRPEQPAIDSSQQ